jgi:hypothetical protein
LSRRKRFPDVDGGVIAINKKKDVSRTPGGRLRRVSDGMVVLPLKVLVSHKW